MPREFLRYNSAQPVCCLWQNRALYGASMFDQFIRQQIKTQGTTINLVRGGNGDPVLARLSADSRLLASLRRYLPTGSRSSALTFVVLATAVYQQVTRNT